MGYAVDLGLVTADCTLLATLLSAMEGAATDFVWAARGSGGGRDVGLVGVS